MTDLQLGRKETTGNNCKWTAGFVGSTATTCCDGGDPAVWFTTLIAVCEQPNGRVCVKDAGRGGWRQYSAWTANSPYAADAAQGRDLERAADINDGDNDSESTAGSVAVLSRRPCNRQKWAGTLDDGEIESSSVRCRRLLTLAWSKRGTGADWTESNART